MIWVLASLAVAIAAAAATAITLAVKLGSERAASAKLAARGEQLLTSIASLGDDLSRESLAHIDTQNRMEKVITDLKATNKVLEEELAVSLDSDVVRGRLVRSGLFRSPEEGAAPASGTAPGLPGVAASPVGTGGRGDGGRG